MEKEMVSVGKILHYFEKIGVAVVELESTLKVGDEIHIKGDKTNFRQTVETMQVEHNPIREANAGDSVGMKVREKVRMGDIVYREQAE